MSLLIVRDHQGDQEPLTSEMYKYISTFCVQRKLRVPQLT